MNRTIDYLNTFDEYELAFFAKFKQTTYLPNTQKIISDYLLEKGFTSAKIDRLIANNPIEKLSDQKERCTRCYSDKIRKNLVEWDTMNKKFEGRVAQWSAVGGKATMKEEVICNVCGFWIKDPNQEKSSGLWARIKDYYRKLV